MTETNELIAELALAVLVRDVPEDRLRAGDVGTVMVVHPARDGRPSGYTLEFPAPDGHEWVVTSLPSDALRPATEADIRNAQAAGRR